MTEHKTLEVRGGSVELSRRSFDDMGTEIELLLETDVPDESAPAFDAVEAEFERLNLIFSRFLPDSELSALNEAGTLVVGPEMLEVTELALAARERTGGRFDPTIHDALVAAGYDRSFEDVQPEGMDDDGRPVPGCGGDVRIDMERSLIQLGPGVRLDFGGIAKGYAVDRACDLLAEAGPCLVNAGGDLAVRGTLGGDPWPVGVDVPTGSMTLNLGGGAMATTGRDLRRWSRNGQERHHVIDPATGRPSESDILRITVVAHSAVAAEVLAKSLFLAGEQCAVREAGELGVPCVLVSADDRLVLAGGLE